MATQPDVLEHNVVKQKYICEIGLREEDFKTNWMQCPLRMEANK